MSPELKKYIEELKANDDFLVEGLERFKMTQLRTGAIVTLCFSILFAIVGNLEIALLVFFIFSCFWISLYSFFAKPHLLHNDGEIAVGIVTSSSYHWLISPFSLGWSFMYEFAHNGKKYVGHKTLTKGKYYHFSGGVLPTEGAEIVVFFNKDNPKKNIPFIPRFFLSTCLKKSRYKKVMKHYFKERKDG